MFSAFGLGYRYAMWLRRPPTRLYWFRGWQIFLNPKRLPANLARLVRLFWNNVVLQRFIERRSTTRWAAHWFLAWGCLLAAAVTFPLSFGWIRFETAPDNQQIYRAFVFGVHVVSFPLDSLIAPLVFNVLDICAVMVLIGVFVAMWRRGRDRGAHERAAVLQRPAAADPAVRDLGHRPVPHRLDPPDARAALRASSRSCTR